MLRQRLGCPDARVASITVGEIGEQYACDSRSPAPSRNLRDPQRRRRRFGSKTGIQPQTLCDQVKSLSVSLQL
jgi:hypothetical protein